MKTMRKQNERIINQRIKNIKDTAFLLITYSFKVLLEMIKELHYFKHIKELNDNFYFSYKTR